MSEVGVYVSRGDRGTELRSGAIVGVGCGGGGGGYFLVLGSQ
jgi:hypothetical protein